MTPHVAFEGLKGRYYFRKVAFRNPLKGEHYLSGAIPTAYLAPNDLTSAYWVVVPTYEAYEVRKYQKGASS